MHLPAGQYAEGEHTQYRTIGVAGQLIYGIDGAGVIQIVEYHYGSAQGKGHRYVYCLSGLGEFLLALEIGVQYVQGEGSGQGREG